MIPQGRIGETGSQSCAARNKELNFPNSLCTLVTEHDAGGGGEGILEGIFQGLCVTTVVSSSSSFLVIS